MKKHSNSGGIILGIGGSTLRIYVEITQGISSSILGIIRYYPQNKYNSNIFNSNILVVTC